ILLITFIVILMTLVLQGLTLPWLINKFNIVVKDLSEEQELEIQMHLVNALLAHLDEHYSHEVATDKAFKMLKERNEHFRTLQQKQLKKRIPDSVVNAKYFDALLDLIEVKRRALVDLKNENKYPDELIKNVEKGLDHDEARLRVHVKPEE
ncbi:MAG TPA: Na+/H+ antiporter, partial [Saprospiraceae bacterium]|nr:Na+/H+ antiporter [Saprospiraceae bacterium]